MPLYFTNGGKIVKPLYKKGEYYVYKESDIPIVDGKALFKTPYYSLKVDIKEDIFMEILEPRSLTPLSSSNVFSFHIK